MSFSGIEIDGLNELVDAFKKLPDEANAKLVEPSVLSATIIMSRAKAKINRITFNLADSMLVTKPSKRKINSGQVIAKVGFSQKKADGTGGNGYYGAQLELGHRLVFFGHKTLKTVPAHPFMRPAADESKEEVADIMTTAMNDVLNEMGGAK